MRRTTEGAASREDAVRTTRLRWFTGRFITARDLTDEQEYHLDRHRLHNRLLHGWGVVCGLEVHPHDKADCAHEWVWVDPGIAIDCRGREIILPHREAVRWPVDPDAHQRRGRPRRPVPALRGVPHRAAARASWTTARTARHGAGPGGRAVAPRGPPGAARPERPVGGAGPRCRADPTLRRLRRLRWHDGSRAAATAAWTPRVRAGRLRAPRAAEPVSRRGHRGGRRARRLRPGVRRSLPPPATYLTHVVGTCWEHGRT